MPEEQTTALTTMADLEGSSGQGLENVGQGDLQTPRICVAQSLTPQTKKSNENYIEGLNEGDLFNDLTGEIYHLTDTEIVVVDFLGSRNIEFDEDGNIVDYNVPPNDPRTKFTTNERGKRVKPKATKFMDYLMLVTAGCETPPELVAWSAKSLAIRVAQRLNSILRMPLRVDNSVFPTPPSWARKFSVETVESRRDKYTFYEIRFKPTGVAPPDVREMAKGLYEQFHGAKLSRDADKEEAAAVASEGSGEIPF